MTSAHPQTNLKFAAVCVAAIGVVYGDIGTSPLYAFRECFNPEHGVPPTADNVLGCFPSSSGR